MEVDLIPGTSERKLTIKDLKEVMRGRHFVVLRMDGKMVIA
jgi:hypothetical protein